MSEYLSILQLIMPVFLMLGIGMVLRWKGFMQPAAEKGIVQLVVSVFYPCLIISSMIEADRFEVGSGSLWAPVAGFVTVAFGFLAAYTVGRMGGIKMGSGLRTFAFSVAIYNYGYLPIPLMQSMFGPNELAVLFVHNVGIEIAIWTVGVSLLAGGSLRDGLRRIVNPMVVALVIGLALNMTGGAAALPVIATQPIALLAACAIPLGLLAIGSSLFENLRAGESLWEPRVSLLGTLLRLGVLPLLGLWLAWYFPFPLELKRVLVFEAAMPAGIMPIVLAKHYGGQSIVAVRIVFASTALGMLTMPLWIRFGLELIGS